MSLLDWAKREIELVCRRRDEKDSDPELDYFQACCESALKAYQSLLEDGHSGASINETKFILTRLLEGKPLTPIEDTPDIWCEDTFRRKDKQSLQCKRKSSLFKDVYSDGSISYHDIDRCRCVNIDNPVVPWYNGFISNLIHEKYPITMPYCPEAKPYVVYCTEGLYDPKNGDFDTIGIWYVIKPDGEKDTIERFFKESPESFVEISKEEYFERVGDKNENS